MNGQRFHQQKRIEMKTEQCERGKRRGLVWGPRIHSPFWSMIYLLLKLKFISDSKNGIESEFQCEINRGPEWTVEFSIPIQILYKHFLNFWALKMSDFTKRNFLI